VRVTWLGHASVLLDIGGVRILTDPLLRPRLGPLRRRHDLPLHRHVDDVDLVLLSHLHHDHADLPSLRRLGQVPVVTDPANLPWLDKHGLGVGDASSETWHTVAPGVEVLLVRADHEARPMPHRPNGTTGMLVRGGGVVVWFAGDTSLHPDMELLPQLADGPIDLALLPVGGWGPRLSPGHMGPGEAAEAAVRSGARHVVPIHYGTLHPTGWPTSRLAWTTDPGHRFAEPCGRHGCRRPRPRRGRRRHGRRAAVTTSHSAAAVSCGWVSGNTCKPCRTVTTRTHLAERAARA
jgi:L-ascorbate metabolism protein UlaG (beta-lactamase superfamily)